MHYFEHILVGLILSFAAGVCAFAIINYESDRCSYREIRGFSKILESNGLCGIL